MPRIKRTNYAGFWPRPTSATPAIMGVDFGTEPDHSMLLAGVHARGLASRFLRVPVVPEPRSAVENSGVQAMAAAMISGDYTLFEALFCDEIALRTRVALIYGLPEEETVSVGLIPVGLHGCLEVAARPRPVLDVERGQVRTPTHPKHKKRRNNKVIHNYYAERAEHGGEASSPSPLLLSLTRGLL